MSFNARGSRSPRRPAEICIVVVDDHTFIRELICRALPRHSAEYSVAAAAGTAAEAIAACREFKPHLVILDINLPDRSGVAAVPDIRRVSPATRVLLCSAFPKDDWITEATACGADGFVEKTNTWDEFMEAVRRVARGERYFSAAPRAARPPLPIKDAATAVGITVRERQILQLIARGLTTKEIAAQLSISVPTVGTHRGNLMTKTGARNVAALVRFACDAGATAD